MRICPRDIPPRSCWALEQAGIHPLLARLYAARGITSATEIDDDLTHLLPPGDLAGSEQAAHLLADAIAANRHICVVADYDCDGATACAVALRGLRLLGAQQTSYLVPDRISDGYGLTPAIADRVHALGAELLLTVDNGIASVEGVSHAQSLGLQVVVTDHHLPGDTLPAANALVNPNLPNCPFASKNLAGVGVMFYVLLALRSELRRRGAFPAQEQPRLDTLLPLVALGTVADVVRLDANNRRLVAQGLKRIRRGQQPAGMAALFAVSGRAVQTASTFDLGFALGPRINAAGRMRMDENDENASPSGGHAAVELLIEGNESIAAEFGNVIDAYNQDRKSIDRSVTQEAHDFIERNPAMKELKSTVIYNPKWMKGIVGIVASRLIETYYRPTVVLTMSNGFVTGSARSVPGFDLYQAVESCSDLLENFGGHMYAAGLTMRPENVEEFTRRFNAYVEENIDPQMLVPQVDIDSELLFSDITPAFRKDLNRFQPFGPGNTAPVFATYGVSNHGDAKLVGMECEHLRMDLIQRQKPNTKIQSIAFQQPTHYEWVRSGRPIDVCYQIVENHYRGTVTTQLRIKDIKPVMNR